MNKLQHQASKEFKYFVHDPDGDTFTFFADTESRDKHAEECIQYYLDDGWDEAVINVCAGEITHTACMVNKVFRVGDVDADGIDEVGEEWLDDWNYKCDYKLKPLGFVCPSTLKNEDC